MAMTRALARELGEHGIRVNTLAPGFTLERHRDGRESRPRADRARARGPVALAQARRASRRTCWARWSSCASADSDFVTGQTIAVDGGNVNT